LAAETKRDFSAETGRGRMAPGFQQRDLVDRVSKVFVTIRGSAGEDIVRFRETLPVEHQPSNHLFTFATQGARVNELGFGIAKAQPLPVE
jgi:hypothetical protein